MIVMEVSSFLFHLSLHVYLLSAVISWPASTKKSRFMVSIHGKDSCVPNTTSSKMQVHQYFNWVGMGLKVYIFEEVECNLGVGDRLGRQSCMEPVP